ncbi:uncharacterized protein JCM6883_002287 [Sporobolomyces salmoneus]|uniref:uncharacterized protein n=1 Tax=Sporobolomyces salmoneus TaxID=183962 RepID=UPI00317E57CC
MTTRFQQDVLSYEKPDGEIEHRETRFADSSSLAAATTRDSEKGSSRYASSTVGIDHVEANKKAERKLVRKLDSVILPMAVLLYLSAYLDRGNMGSARLQGLEKGVLDGDDTKYSIALSCFFLAYIALSIPGTLLAKMYNPSRTIACGSLIWSVGATCQAAAYNPAGLYVTRLFVGVGEAMFGQAMAFHLSLWYKKTELAKRVGLFVSAGALSGAFSGLLAFGVQHIQSSIPQYKILFLIEGLPSLLLAIIVFFFLPSRPDTSRFLSEEERTIACTRLNSENSLETNTGIVWKDVRYTLINWRTWVVAISYSAMNLGLGSVSGFLPTIIKGLGYTNAEAQLYSVPPYAVALVFMLLLTTWSDKRQSRGFPIMAVFAIGIVGWSILLGVNPHHASHSDLRVRYFGVICVVTAGYSAIPLIISWQAANVATESQKAAVLGSLNSVGQCLSVLAAFSFPSKEGPHYIKGISLNIAFQALGLLITLAMTTYYRLENRRRDKHDGGRPLKGVQIEGLHEKYDLAPSFRYTP